MSDKLIPPLPQFYSDSPQQGSGLIRLIRSVQDTMRASKVKLSSSQLAFINEDPNRIAKALGWLKTSPIVGPEDSLSAGADGLKLIQKGRDPQFYPYSSFLKIPADKQESDTFIATKSGNELKGKKENFVLMIDIGHGSKKENGFFDYGAVVDQNAKPILKAQDIVLGESVTEEQLVEDFVLKTLRPKLEKLGYLVLVSREGDIKEEEDTKQRVKRINGLIKENHVDASISVHANSGQPSARGFEVFYYHDDDKMIADQIASAVKEKNIQGLKIHDGPSGTGSKHDKDSSRERLAFCRDLDSPSALVELAFLTNQEDLKLLQDPKFLDSYADALVNGLRNYQEIKEPKFTALKR